MNNTPLFSTAVIYTIMHFMATNGHAEAFNCKFTSTDRELIAANNDCVFTKLYAPLLMMPPVNKFLAYYLNPDQHKLPADGIYPLGQKMPISGYSNTVNDTLRMNDAGFSMDGPRYQRNFDPPHWENAESLGMRNYFQLFIDDYNGKRYWDAVLPRMKTVEGRAFMKQQIEDKINHVQSIPGLNNNIAAWYGYPEEPFERATTPIDEQRAYIEFVHNIITKTDNRKRPYYVIERGDSNLENMIANQCHQDGSMKENYMVQSNKYEDDDEIRVLMWRWARDQVIAAEQNDATCPSYTGSKRAAISTLEMFRDPIDTSKRNEEWLRKIITHDIYIQLAAGIDGFALFSWSAKSSSQDTVALQKDIYLDVLGKIISSGLDMVFLWGDERSDIQMEIVSGPKTVQWRFGSWYTAPSIRMRNIQYGKNRYILLVNSAKEAVIPKLSGFPDGLQILDMIPDKWYGLGSSISPIIQPLGVRMYKIE